MSRQEVTISMQTIVKMTTSIERMQSQLVGGVFHAKTCRR